MKKNYFVNYFKKNVKYIPIMILALFVPIITYYIYYEIPQSIVSVMHQGAFKVDMYTVGKSYLLNFSGFLMLAYLIYSVDNKNRESLKRLNTDFKLLLLMFVFITLSTVFSEYREVALFGFVERSEGYLSWFVYLLTILYISVLAKEKIDFEKILNLVKYSSLVVGVIGILEYNGYNILIQDWYGNIFSSEIIKNAEYLIAYGYDKTIKTTLYNSNFAGSFFVMTSLLFLSDIIFKKSKKIFNCFGFILSLLCLFGTKSSAGLLGFVVCILFLALMIFSKSSKSKVMVAMLIVVSTLSGLYAVSGRNSLISSEISNVTSVKGNTVSQSGFNKLHLEDNTVTVGFEEKLFKFKFNGSGIEFYDTFDSVLEYRFFDEDMYFEFSNNDYKDIKIEVLGKGNIFRYTQKDMIFYIGIEKSRVIILDSVGNSYDELGEIRSIGFDGYELIGNSRGYIWSRSLPLVFDNLLIGSGPDTFAFYFPQEDFIGKLNYFGSLKYFVDKPHNMFIQMGVNFGLAFLIIYLVFLFKYIISTFHIYINDNYGDLKDVALASMLAVLAFNVSGLFNDTSITTSPTYWTIFAVGLAVNVHTMKLKKQI